LGGARLADSWLSGQHHDLPTVFQGVIDRGGQRG